MYHLDGAKLGAVDWANLNEKSILESDFWKLFNKVSPTSFYGVPFTYEILLKLNYGPEVSSIIEFYLFDRK